MRETALRALRVLCFAAGLISAAPGGVLAQSASDAADFLSALAGFAGKSGPEIGAAVSRSIYSDDPAIEQAIAKFYADLKPVNTNREPTLSPEPAPSPDILALFDQARAASSGLLRPEPALPAEYLAAVDRALSRTLANERLRQMFRTSWLEGFDAPGPNWQPVFRPSRDPAGGTSALGSVVRVPGCTVSDVTAALAPFEAAVVRLAGDDAAAIKRHFDGYRPDVGQPALALAHDLDALSGGNYWTQRWHAKAAHLMVGVVSIGGILYDAIFAAKNAALEAERNQGKALTVQAAAPFYAKVTELRRELLLAIRDLISALRARGCEDQADRVHVLAAESFAVGEERRAYERMDPNIWRTRNVYPPTFDDVLTPQWIRYLRSSVYLADGPADALITGPDVSAVLGPLPEIKALSRSVADLTPASKRPLQDFIDAGDPIDFSLERSAEDTREGENDDQDDSWERPDRRGQFAMEGARRGQLGGSVRGAPTWLSAAGMGAWPQPDLGGFWKTDGIADAEGQITLIEVTDEGSKFTGRIVEKGELHGYWIRMEKDGAAHAWRGEISIAQLPIPPGRCPRWTRGAFLTPPAAHIINGAWTAKKVDPDTCDETEEPEHGLVKLERVVATGFQPIIPGKYIHIIAVPGGGSTAAQYKAAVEFKCSTAGLPPVEPRITVSAGEIVAGKEPCRYQLVVTAPGSYDITVEFHDSAGKVLHRDFLRADVPPIPGLTP